MSMLSLTPHITGFLGMYTIQYMVLHITVHIVSSKVPYIILTKVRL